MSRAKSESRRFFHLLAWLQSILKSPNFIGRNLARDIHYFRSYSQFGEDVLMHSLFDDRPKTYVDVGSGHPMKGSNTYFMYRAGFRGLLIDPIAANCELSKNFRPEDQVLLAGAGSTPGVMEFFEFEPYQFSTFDHKTKDLRISEEIKFYGT